MLHFCQTYKGAISVFLSLILLPVFLLAGVIIDGSRLYACRNIVSGAGDLAMNAALADYDPILKDMYGLFAMVGEEVSDDTVRKYFSENINAQNLDRGGSYGRLPVYLTLEDGNFTVNRVENTESYQTAVMLQQVLEYSKYRVPIAVINDGMLDGLGAFQGMDKKVDAIKSQLKFEEELTDLQQVLEKLKKQLDIQDKLYEYFQKEYPSVIPNAEKNYALVSRLLIASQVLKGDVGTEGGSCRDLMEKFVEEAGGLGTGGGSAYGVCQTAAGNFEALYRMKRIHNGIDDTGKVFDGLKEGTDEWKEAEQLLENYSEAAEKMGACESMLHSCMTPLIKETNRSLNKAYKNADQGIDCTEEIIKLSKKVIEKNSEGSSLKNAHKDFGKKIGQLEDAELREPMKQEYDDYSRLLDNSKVERLIAQTENNKTFYSETRDGVEGITYCSKEVSIADYTSGDFSGNAGGYMGGVTSNSSLGQQGESFYRAEFRGSEFVVSVEIADLQKEEFYQFVQEKCDVSSVDEGRQQGEIDKANKNLAKGNETRERIEKNDVSTQPVDLSDVPTVWLEQIGSTEAEVALETEGSADNDNSRKKVSGSVRNSLDEVKEKTAGLSQLSESIVGGSINGAVMQVLEAFLVSGYESRMFSYYTADKGGDGSAETKSSLTGYAFSSENNVMYRSEMEYMLFGKDVPAANVRNAKASIFAIRYGLNAIGAFSSSSLRAEADAAAMAIVGATGGTASFALPLIRSVIILGTTYVETDSDMRDLLEGKAVIVAKFGNGWHLTGFQGKGSADFKLDYHQYLTIFLIINNMFDSGKAQSLARAADCIELNVRNKGSTMKEKQTMVALDATVNLETMFMRNVAAELRAQGRAVRDEDGKDYRVRYHGILGY